MANSNPTPRKPGPGVHRKLSVYLTPELLAELEAATADLTPQQRSRTLGRWLILGCTTERQFERVMAGEEGS